MTEMMSTREAYGKALSQLGGKYDIVVLDADLSKSTRTELFKNKYPERFLNAGIAEGNMMSTAAGIASCGKVVFASSFAMFAAGRAFEQIRNSIGYPNLNVKIGATHAGISAGEDGATHQCLEDIGIMRTIPNMTIIAPADPIETMAAVEAAINHDGPVYLRLGRLEVPDIFNKNSYTFELGKGIVVEDGNDVTIIAAGLMVHEALKAGKILNSEGIKARIIDIHTIKPIDRSLIAKAAKETGAIVTVEDHNIIGGLGSAVAEVLAEECPAPMRRVGMEDKFGRSGKPGDLLNMYGLTADNIAKKAKEVMALR